MRLKSFVLLLALVLAGCSASKKALEQARQYEASGLYVEAAEADIKALRKDPKFKDAKVHLRKVAPRAYEELLTRGENLEKAASWDEAVDAYGHLSDLLDRMQKYGVVPETINVRARLATVKQKAARSHYENAERLFDAKSWGKAASEYLLATRFVDNFNGSLDKAIQALLNSGNLRMQAGKYAAALKAFSKILDVAPGHRQAKEKMAEAHFRLGRQLYDEGRFRKALAHFEKTEELKPELKEAQIWADRAYEKAVRYVAVFPFINRTSLDIDGSRIASDILNRMMQANLQFVDFLSHPETVSLLSHSRFSRYDSANESELLDLAEEQGLHSVVWGEVHDIEVQDTPEKMKENRYEKVVSVRDSAGTKIEETQTIYFREYTRKRQVRVRVDAKILEVATGAILDRQSYSEEIRSAAHWVAYSGSIYDLPEDKRPLLDAPRNPRPVAALADEALAKITALIGRDAIRFYR